MVSLRQKNLRTTRSKLTALPLFAGCGELSSIFIHIWRTKASIGIAHLWSLPERFWIQRAPNSIAQHFDHCWQVWATPATRLIDTTHGKGSPSGDSAPRWCFTADSLLLVTIDRYSDLSDYDGATQRLRRLIEEIPKSKGVVFDLRSAVPWSEDDS